jgi:hypothetical protein
MAVQLWKGQELVHLFGECRGDIDFWQAPEFEKSCGEEERRKKIHLI